MNKILIVGHPSSRYEEVERLLNDCGMGTARPSRREGLMPAEISATLCKAHRASSLRGPASDEQVEQVQVAPVWHGMALDLMLGNLDQDFWGWADPKAIHLLDYWRDLDPSINFVFVYQEPNSALMQASENEPILSCRDLQQRVDDWCAFNAALLHFFLRNTDRCLLVHAKQVSRSVNTYLQQLRSRIGAPLSEPPDQLSAHGGLIPERTSGSEEPKGGTAVAADDGYCGPLRAGGTDLVSDDKLELFLSELLTDEHQHARQLYEELQSVANLPLVEAQSKRCSALDAWVAMAERQRLIESQAAEGQQKQAEINRLGLILTAAESNARNYEQQVASLRQALNKAESEGKQEIASLQETLRMLEQANGNGQQENALLLSQLHQVQEELERRCLDDQRHLKALAEKERALADAQGRVAELQSQCEAVTGSSATTRKLGEENALLLAQLHQAQEQLERCYLEQQALKSRSKAAQPASSEVDALYGAAERVKQQLTYRLGATMIERSRSLGGWLSMPLALMQTTRQFRKERGQRSGEKRVPISRYRDAHEAERLKQHLSYRLGATLLANAQSPVGWVKLPFAVRREVEHYRQQRAQKP